jgi:acetoin utilization deacetylase AcuC-like enzyme
VKIYHTDHIGLTLPPEHRFPISKYSLLRQGVATSGLAGVELLVPTPATEAQLCLAHDPSYVRRVLAGELSAAEVRRIGFPWSPGLVERSLRSVGGTIEASRAALAEKRAANLGGGTHHAGAGAGEGYCVFNDVAVAVRVAQSEGRLQRAAVVDTDVHQGNGTAAIFRGDPSVYTFSLHGARNFPFRKEAGDLDIELPDGAGDAEFLWAVEIGLRAALDRGPELVYYIAGADAHEGDRLGRLRVSQAALAERDRVVLDACQRAAVPVVVVMGGGYGRDIRDTVEIQLHSVLEAVRRSGG